MGSDGDGTSIHCLIYMMNASIEYCVILLNPSDKLQYGYTALFRSHKHKQWRKKIEIYLWCCTQNTTYWCTRIRIIKSPKMSVYFFFLANAVFLLWLKTHIMRNLQLWCEYACIFPWKERRKSYRKLLQKWSFFDKTFR